MICDIRQATLNDLELLLNFSRETFYEFFAHLNKPEDIEAYSATAFTRERILAELQDPASVFYFAMVGDEIAGYLKLNTGSAQTEFGDDKHIEIERIYVTGLHHGKGIGGQLLKFAIEAGANLGKEFIWLGVWEHNSAAIGFYRYHGFEVFGSHDFILGSDHQTDLLMGRWLTGSGTFRS